MNIQKTDKPIYILH